MALSKILWIGLSALGVLLGAALALAAIVLFSLYRGIRYRSVPKTIGTFFRGSGLLAGALVSALFLPFVLYFNLSWTLFGAVAAGLLLLGFLAGRAISRIIGFKVKRIVFYIRIADGLLTKIKRFAYAL